MPRRFTTSLGGALLFTAGLAAGQLVSVDGTAEEHYPTEHKGLEVATLGVVPEASMIRQTGLEGYFLQLRVITIAPGGQIARHSHATRPGLVYMLEGEVTEGRPQGEQTLKADAASALVEDADTEHWVYNRSEAPAKALVCDLGIVGS